MHLPTRDILCRILAASVCRERLCCLCTENLGRYGTASPSHTLCKPPVWCRIEAPHRRLYYGKKESHPGRKCPQGKDTDNSRNGHSSKTLRTGFGEVGISVPRDRKGEFEPQVLRRNQTGIGQDIKEKLLSMYAKGMTTSDIEAHIRDIYDVEVSDATVSPYYGPSQKNGNSGRRRASTQWFSWIPSTTMSAAKGRS